MSQSKPSFANPSLWGASWKLEVQAGDSVEFDEVGLKQSLERHFGPARDNYEDAVNLLRNDAIVQYGTQEEQTAHKIADDLRSLNFICGIVQQSSDPHEKFPAFLAPPDAYLSPPIILSVSGYSDEEGAETASRLISRLCMILPSSAVKAALEKCRLGAPIEFTVSYQEHADSLSQRLEELGYTVDVSRASRGLFDD